MRERNSSCEPPEEGPRMDTDYAALPQSAAHVANYLPRDQEPEPAAGGKARLLIVDDVRENREILKRRLERHGFHAIEAGGGHEALRLIERKTFDLVLLDMMMPDI